MEKEKIINNIIINLLNINIKDNIYILNTLSLLSYIEYLKTKDKEKLKIIYKNLEEQLEG